MKERPITFSGPMVRVILEGRKTQTRRIVTPQPTGERLALDMWEDGIVRQCPYGLPGDRLWVREAWRTYSGLDEFSPKRIGEICMLNGYKSPWMPMQFEVDGDRINWNDYQYQPGRYRHARFMPRWASRILLEITDVRVERLREITRSDIRSEGLVCPDEFKSDDLEYNYRHWYPDAFESLWDGIHGPGSWKQNPWVWVITFKRIE